MPATVARPFTDRIDRINPSATLVMMAQAAKMRAQGIDIVDLGAGEPHFATPQHIKQAGVRAIEEDFTKYTPAAGIPELRRAIVERHAANWHSQYSPEEAIVTPGGKFALFLALQVLVQAGDEVIIPVPYWVSFPDMVAYTGATPVYVRTSEEEDFRLTAAQIERAITPRTKAIIINTPNNPSGAVIAAEEYERVVMMAHKRGIFTINDECYVQLNYAAEKDRISAGRFTAAKEHMVIIGSMSKSYAMTGWRSGFGLASKQVMDSMIKLQTQSTSSICSVMQKAALAALTGPQECVATMREDYKKLREECLAGLRKVPHLECKTPSGAFYAYPNVSAYFGKNGIGSATDISDRLLNEAHVVTNPGDAFGTKEHIRLSYAVSHPMLAEALTRIGNWFEQQL